MGRFSRQKGKRAERETAKEIREAFPDIADGVRRGWQTREGDDDPDVIGLPGYWLENKGLARYNLAPLIQATNDAKGRGEPIAVIRVNNKRPVVMMYWQHFLSLLQEVYENRSRHGKRPDQNLRPRRGEQQVLPRARRWVWRP